MLQRIQRLTCGFALLFTIIMASLPRTVTQAATKPATNAVLAVAFRLDSASPGMSAYIGDTKANPFNVPPGAYNVLALDAQGRLISQDNVQVKAGDSIQLPGDFGAAGGVKAHDQAAALKTLANFLSDSALGQLLALQGASAGFTGRIFDSSNKPTQAQFDPLTAWYADAATQQAATLKALDVIQSKVTATQAAVSLVAYRALPSSQSVPAVAAGPFDSLKSKLLGFFGYAGDAGKRARERILQIGANLNPADRDEAFNAVRSGFKSDATNWNEFVQLLQSGKLDNQAAQIESDMRQATGFAAEAQATHNTTGDVVYREGAELVKQGAELDAEVIKTVLGQSFPDITKGFDLANKADEWATYIQNVYKATAGQDPAALQELIKQHIKDDLSKCCSDLPDDVANQIADSIGQRAVNAVDSTSAPSDSSQASVSNGGQTGSSGSSGSSSAPAGGQDVDISREGTVEASTVADGFPASAAVDGDPSTSWFSTGPDPNGAPTTFRWTGQKDDFIDSITLMSNRLNANPDFRTGYGFDSVTIAVLDASQNTVFQATASLSGNGPDVVLHPQVVGRSILLILSDDESQNCGGFGEMIVVAKR